MAADIHVIDVATRKETPVATSRAAESTPRFSPDGTRVAYSVRRGADFCFRFEAPSIADAVRN